MEGYEARDEGLIARLSGDEFAIAMPLSALPQTVEQFAERIVIAFERPWRLAQASIASRSRPASPSILRMEAMPVNY
jgi:GGDEF domain-containing protein